MFSPLSWGMGDAYDVCGASMCPWDMGGGLDRPPLCPFRLLPLLIYSGSTVAFLKHQGPKSKNIEKKILL